MNQFEGRRFRIVVFNVENLFLHLDHYSGQDLSAITEKEWQGFSASTTPNKPLAQLRHIARSILELDPDLLMLCEVGGAESLANFSRLFLNDVYEPHLLEGNSDRGIDIGYLAKRRLGFTFDVCSHKHRAIDFLYEHERLSKETGYGHLGSARITSHRFSRDVLELRTYGDSEKEPLFIALLVHLKSQLDRNRIDPGGRDRRKAELEKLIQIYHEIRGQFGGRVPVVLAGDFNGVAALPEPDPEFAALYRETDLKDCLEAADVPTDERFTYQQLHHSRVGVNRQLDYIFIPPELAARVDRAETWVYRFSDESGRTMLIPRNLNEKRSLPSDHFPVVLTLKPLK